MCVTSHGPPSSIPHGDVCPRATLAHLGAVLEPRQRNLIVCALISSVKR